MDVCGLFDCCLHETNAHRHTATTVYFVCFAATTKIVSNTLLPPLKRSSHRGVSVSEKSVYKHESTKQKSNKAAVKSVPRRSSSVLPARVENRHRNDRVSARQPPSMVAARSAGFVDCVRSQGNRFPSVPGCKIKTKRHATPFTPPISSFRHARHFAQRTPHTVRFTSP